MSALPAWMYRNPEEIADRLVELKGRLEAAAKESAERDLRKKRRRIRRLLKAALRGATR